jgi:hypothetical protein
MFYCKQFCFDRLLTEFNVELGRNCSEYYGASLEPACI